MDVFYLTLLSDLFISVTFPNRLFPFIRVNPSVFMILHGKGIGNCVF